MSTVKKYLSGLRSIQLSMGMGWTIVGDFTVARTLRGLLKRYGVRERALKVPVTVTVMLRMFPLLPGWPDAQCMTHDDRLFCCVTQIATLALLRGGEFCVSPASDRPVLNGRDVVAFVGLRARVEVAIPAMKTKWWRPSVTAVAYDPASASGISPVQALREYRDRSTVVLLPDGPAFCTSNGRAMTKTWLIAKPTALCAQAGVVLTDAEGAPVRIRASSWRAGGVLDARRAGLSDAVTKALGRWASNAHLSYYFISGLDLK